MSNEHVSIRRISPVLVIQLLLTKIMRFSSHHYTCSTAGAFVK